MYHVNGTCKCTMLLFRVNVRNLTTTTMYADQVKQKKKRKADNAKPAAVAKKKKQVPCKCFV